MSGICLVAKDCTVTSAFPLLLPPLPWPLCQNVDGNGNNVDENNGGSSSGGGNVDSNGNSSCVGGCMPLLFCLACMQRCSKKWLTMANREWAERSFQDKPTYCI
jgi:hypothetical protein